MSATSGYDALRGPNATPQRTAGAEGRARAQEAYAERLLEMRERTPKHAVLVSPETPTWRDVARRLAPDEAFIEYLVSDSGSLAFVIVSDTFAAVDLGAGRRDLARLVEFARGTLERRAAARTDSLWRGPLRRLHQHLFAPLEETGLLGDKTRLVLVPHGELHYLPCAALLESGAGNRFLVERYEVTVTPSAAGWLALAGSPPGRSAAVTA